MDVEPAMVVDSAQHCTVLDDDASLVVVGEKAVSRVPTLHYLAVGRRPAVTLFPYYTLGETF